MDRSWVVVYLNTGQCPEYEGTRCVMEAHGPFTEDESDRFMENAPRAFAPHRVKLTSWITEVGPLS